MEKNIEALKSIGGNEWIKNNYHRVYFNQDQILETYGLSVSRYNTGNVSSASLNGESISNSQAKKIINRAYGKLYYDVNDGQFHSKDIDEEITQDVIEKFQEVMTGQRRI